MNLYETLSRRAAEFSARPALIDGPAVLDYQTLWREVEALRVQLGRLGVRDGQGVGVLARNGRAFVVSALAALGCGAVVMPIYHQLKPAELADNISRGALCAVIEDGSCARAVDGIHHTLALLDRTPLRLTRLTGRAAAPMIPWIPDAAFVRFTSGTTGASKGVILSHTALLERIESANRGLCLGPEDVVLCVMPMAYHFFVSVLLYLSVGAAIAVTPDHLAESLLDAAARDRATFLYAAPMHIRLLAADATGRALPDSLTRVMSVSSTLSPQSARDFYARYEVPVAQGYGIIEVGLPILNIDEAAEHPESIGRPLPDFEAQIFSDDFASLPPGQTGHLALRGPGMFSGYMDPPLPRENVLREGWFLTGDLAHRDESGRFTIDGRSKSVINVAGHKVFPEEVAAVLDAHPRVLRSRITTRPHPQLGETVHAEVELRDNGTIAAEELLAFCRRRLSSFKVPVSVDFVHRVDSTPSGKVRHG